MTLDAIDYRVRPFGLFAMGAFNPDGKGGALVLVGAAADFWAIFQQTAEFHDVLPDPIDRYSKRVIGSIARDLGARASFPSDGPPYAPFVDWGLQTGRFHQSPVGMLVHDVAGLMISIRAALHLDDKLALPAALTASPCIGCAKPCLYACPVSAFKSDHYDVAACKSHLQNDAGQSCMSQGCAARRACPVSQSFGRQPEQSAFHMKAFL